MGSKLMDPDRPKEIPLPNTTKRSMASAGHSISDVLTCMQQLSQKGNIPTARVRGKGNAKTTKERHMLWGFVE